MNFTLRNVNLGPMACLFHHVCRVTPETGHEKCYFDDAPPQRSIQLAFPDWFLFARKVIVSTEFLIRMKKQNTVFNFDKRGFELLIACAIDK